MQGRTNDEAQDLPRCVALAQPHRGHGQSTAVYYLARVLVNERLRVLIVDVTGRRTRLQSLMTRGPAKNLGIWAPPLARPTDLRPLLAQARRNTRGRVDVLLLDADAAVLERAGGLAAGLDAVAVVVEPTLAGQAAADRVAERLGDQPPPYGRVGAIFSRVDVDATELPEQTDQRHTPVLGHFPADYLLAAGDDYSLRGGDPSWPHDSYLFAMLRLGRTLIRTVPLHRMHVGTFPTVAPLPEAQGNGPEPFATR